MKRSTLFALISGCAGVASVSAQPFNLAESNDRNRFGVSFRPAFNIEASFTGLGGFTPQSNPGANPSAGGLNRTYDDGYNLLDARGNAGGLTWNWGYDNGGSGAGTQTPPGQDVVLMHSSSSAATGVSADQSGDAQLGFEISYNRRLGRVGACAWGVELAFNYTDVGIHDSRNVYAPVNQISDAYSLGGVTPPYDAPPAPAYRGSFSRPGALISDQPMRTSMVLPEGALITGQRNLDANVYGWRLGPYLDVPFFSNMAFSFSAGLAVAYVDSDFGFAEEVTIPGVGMQSHAGSGNRSEALFGYYVGGLLSIAVSQQLSLFIGGQWQDVGQFQQTVDSKTATLDLGKSVFLTVGFGWSW